MRVVSNFNDKTCCRPRYHKFLKTDALQVHSTQDLQCDETKVACSNCGLCLPCFEKLSVSSAPRFDVPLTPDQNPFSRIGNDPLQQLLSAVAPTEFQMDILRFHFQNVWGPGGRGMAAQNILTIPAAKEWTVRYFIDRAREKAVQTRPLGGHLNTDEYALLPKSEKIHGRFWPWKALTYKQEKIKDLTLKELLQKMEKEGLQLAYLETQPPGWMD